MNIPRLKTSPRSSSGIPLSSSLNLLHHIKTQKINKTRAKNQNLVPLFHKTCNHNITHINTSHNQQTCHMKPSTWIYATYSWCTALYNNSNTHLHRQDFSMWGNKGRQWYSNIKYILSRSDTHYSSFLALLKIFFDPDEVIHPSGFALVES